MIARGAAGLGALGVLLAPLCLVEPAFAVCSVFDNEPCVPEILYPLGGDLRRTLVSASVEEGRPADRRQRLAQGPTSRCPPKDPPPEKLNTIQDVFTAFCACWKPPPESDARPGMEITVRFSFNRSGEILGEPRFTFVTRDVSADVRAVYKRAVADTLSRCTPLPFTPALGNALAGRPFALRFIDDRGVKKAEDHDR